MLTYFIAVIGWCIHFACFVSLRVKLKSVFAMYQAPARQWQENYLMKIQRTMVAKTMHAQLQV